VKRTQLKRRNAARTRAGALRLEAAQAEAWGRSSGWCEASTPACPSGRHVAHQFHHRLMRSHGGQHDADNLLHVCSPAHDYIHLHPAESYEAGWLLHRVAM